MTYVESFDYTYCFIRENRFKGTSSMLICGEAAGDTVVSVLTIVEEWVMLVKPESRW